MRTSEMPRQEPLTQRPPRSSANTASRTAQRSIPCPVLHVEESRGPVQVPAIAAASRRDASSMQERMDAFGQATADAMDDTDLVDPGGGHAGVTAERFQ